MSITNLQNYVWNGVDGYVYDPSPDRLYVSAFSSHEVLEIDPSNGQITARIPSEKFPFKSILVNQELLTFSLWESTPSYILEKDVQPWIFFLTCPPTVPRNTWHQTNTLLVGGLNVETPVSVPNIYSVEIWKNGVNVGQSTSVVNDDTIYLRLLTPSTAGEKIELPLFIGEGYHYFESTTVEIDSAVNPFEFTDILGGEISTQYDSNSIIISGIDSDVTLNATVTNGTIIKNGIHTGLNSISVVAGDSIAIRLNSSSNYSSPIFSRLEFGSQYSVWSILTKLDPLDEDPLPTPQNFDSILDADLDTLYEANSYAMVDDVLIHLEPVIGAEIIANGNPVGQTYSASVGDSISIRAKSSIYYNTPRTIKLLGRGYLSEFTIETLDDRSLDYLTYHTNHYVPLNGRTTSNTLTVSGISPGESVELELVPLNVTQSYIYNTMDVRFVKNSVDVESKYVTISSGDELSVSAFVTGASWNGFVQEFKIFTVQRIYDEFNELVEIQRVSEVGFWRYVTAYLIGPLLSKLKEFPILISHQYEKVSTYNHQTEVTEEGVKSYISSHLIDFECVVTPNHTVLTDSIQAVVEKKTLIEISSESVVSKKNVATSDIFYDIAINHIEDISVSGYDQLHKLNAFIDVEYDRITEKTVRTQETLPVVSGVTKATQDVDYISVFGNQFTQDVTYDRIPEKTVRTQDVTYDRIPEKTVRTQETLPLVSGVTKATQDVDYIVSHKITAALQSVEYEQLHKKVFQENVDYYKATKNIVRADPITGSVEAIQVPNLSKHELGESAQPKMPHRSISNVAVEYIAVHKGNYQKLFEYSVEYRYTYNQQICDILSSEFISNAATNAEFSSNLLVFTRSDRFAEIDYTKERYYHFNTVDAEYTGGLSTKLIEFENPYTFQHKAGAWTASNIGYNTEKFGTLGDNLVDHNYSKSGFSSNISPISQYHVTEHSGEKLFDSIVRISGRTVRDFGVSVTRKSVQVSTVDNSYTTPGRTVRDFGASINVASRSAEIRISPEFIVNNSHSVKEISATADVISKTHRSISTSPVVNNSHSILHVDAGYTDISITSVSVSHNGFEKTTTNNSTEIERAGVAYIGTRAKSVSVGEVVKGTAKVIPITRAVEFASHTHHGETGYSEEEFRSFDTELEAINYALALGTIINPKAMRLPDGKWFYYGDANIQNASCKILFNYPAYGWVSGG